MLNKFNRLYCFRFIWPLFLLSAPVTVPAQDSTRTISNIVIVGNEVTDDNVILRELKIRIGDIPNEEKIEESRQRVANLLLFNRVEFRLYPQDEQHLILFIEVTERLYFYPLPILTIHERDWSKWSYGLSAVDMNFRGQNERIWLGFWFGYRPGFGIDFADQWAGDSLHLNTGLSLMKTTYYHRTITDMEESHVTANFILGKWWGLHFNSSLIFNYDRIEVAEDYRDLMQSGKPLEHTFGLALSLRLDTRDLYFYPSSGWFNRVTFARYGLFETYNHYTDIEIDLRRYLSLGPIILAGRFYQKSAFGSVPVYRLNYIGFNERIRGHFNEVREGLHVQILTAETRFNLIPVHYFSLNLPPVPPQYLHNLKIGLSGALFIDSGIVWNYAFEQKIDRYKTGFGFGLLLHLPYVEIFRVDYGFDRDWNGEFIFEVGVSF
jgi:outer membrane protein assembly factor BamA